MRKGIFLALTLVCAPVIAEPTIFGMELGKTNEQDLKAMYAVNHTGINKYSNGNMYSVPTSSINFDGLKDVQAIFGADGKLVAVLTTLPKNKFTYLNNTLSSKYTLVSQQIPFVGDKTATYRDGATEITLDAHHLSFEMSMNYINDDFMTSFKRQSEDEQRQKEQGEASQL